MHVFQDRRTWNMSVQKDILEWSPLNGELANVQWND